MNSLGLLQFRFQPLKHSCTWISFIILQCWEKSSVIVKHCSIRNVDSGQISCKDSSLAVQVICCLCQGDQEIPQTTEENIQGGGLLSKFHVRNIPSPYYRVPNYFNPCSPLKVFEILIALGLSGRVQCRQQRIRQGKFSGMKQFGLVLRTTHS